jgi:hypothetical protein
MKNEKGNVWVNRIISFLAGALLLFAIMSLAVVQPVKSQVADLTTQLDDVQNGAARLLSEAQVLAESGSYASAQRTLNALFEKQPGSLEVVEGRKLYTQIEMTTLAKDQKWEAAVGAIRASWEKATATELLAKAEQDKQLVATNMSDTLINEWAKVKDQVRREWEAQ